jgi:hypothetical protein
METSTTTGPDADLHSYHVPLGKLDPAAITLTDGVKVPAGWITDGVVPQSTLRLVTASEEKAIDVKFEQYGVNAAPPSEYKTAEINIHIREKEAAPKLVNALTRVITACRENGSR